MKVLVTGGAGFIGSHMTRLLLRNKIHVVVLDALTYAGDLRRLAGLSDSYQGMYEFVHGNILSYRLVDDLMSHVDAVIHFAAETHVARSIHYDDQFFTTDVIGTYTLVNSAMKHRDRIKRFIHISTSEVYGTAETDPMTENHPLNPRSPYAAAKAGADRCAYSYWCTYGLPVTILRPFNQYGPYQHPEKLIARFAALACEKSPLTVHGQGMASRDWIYVEDTCDAILQTLLADSRVDGEVLNLARGLDFSNIQIARMFSDWEPTCAINFIPDREGQVHRHVGSTYKAEKLIGWSAHTKFEDGLEQTFQWYKHHPEWWYPLFQMSFI